MCSSCIFYIIEVCLDEFCSISWSIFWSFSIYVSFESDWTVSSLHFLTCSSSCSLRDFTSSILACFVYSIWSSRPVLRECIFWVSSSICALYLDSTSCSILPTLSFVFESWRRKDSSTVLQFECSFETVKSSAFIQESSWASSSFSFMV